jgi:hypothetical protein
MITTVVFEFDMQINGYDGRGSASARKLAIWDQITKDRSFLSRVEKIQELVLIEAGPLGEGEFCCLR